MADFSLDDLQIPDEFDWDRWDDSQAPCISAGSDSEGESTDSPPRLVATTSVPLLQIDEQNQNCVPFELEWTVKANGKNIAQETESKVDAPPYTYWTSTLGPRIDTEINNSTPSNKIWEVAGCNIKVSVDKRGLKPWIKSYRSHSIDWSSVESKLEEWSEFLKSGKTLFVKLLFKFNLLDKVQKSAHNGGGRSATKRMQNELGIQLAGEAAPLDKSVLWKRLYEFFRCPGSPCKNSDGYCWIDPATKIHHPITTLPQKGIAEYFEDVGLDKLKTHADIPDHIKQHLINAQRQQSRSGKPAPHDMPQINININGLPFTANTIQCENISSEVPAVPPLRIPRRGTLPIKRYRRWLEDGEDRENVKRGYEELEKITIEKGFDLDQLHKRRNTIVEEFEKQKDVEPGTKWNWFHNIEPWARESVETPDCDIDENRPI